MLFAVLFRQPSQHRCGFDNFYKIDLQLDAEMQRVRETCALAAAETALPNLTLSKNSSSSDCVESLFHYSVVTLLGPLLHQTFPPTVCRRWLSQIDLRITGIKSRKWSDIVACDARRVNETEGDRDSRR
jgi:hypothetical protein